MAKRKKEAVSDARSTAKRAKTQAEDQASPRDTQAATKPDLVSKRASLLGLPAELRNQIYDYIMDDVYDEMAGDGDDVIEITWTQFSQPAICRTSRQRRTETLALFYNFYFDIEIEDLDFGPHLNHFVWSQGPHMVLEGINSWGNFRAWLHHYWNNQDVPTIESEEGEEASLAERVCRPAFDLVRRLAEAEVEWDTVEAVLDAYKDGTEAGEGMWDFWAW